MRSIQEIQKQFFDQIKDQLPPHLALVDEVSDLLDISSDSAYRRLRGEKYLTLNELVKLGEHFQVSVDTFLKSPEESIPFHQTSVNGDGFNVKSYLQFVLERASLMADNRQQSKIIMIVNDMTVFQLLQFPELAAFKLFFWQKSGLGLDNFRRKRFSIDSINDELLEMGEAVVKEYVKVPSVEVIGIEAVNSFLRQINYYLELGFFKKPNEALVICDKILELVQHFHHQADIGFKFPYGTKPVGTPENYQMYYNELFVIDGLILTNLGDNYTTFIASGPLNLVHTNNENFYHKKYKWAENLLSKSIQLSGVSEKERRKYFMKMEDAVTEFRDQIERKFELRGVE